MEIFRFVQARPAKQGPTPISLRDTSPLGIYLLDKHWRKSRVRISPVDMEVKLSESEALFDESLDAKLHTLLSAVEERLETPGIGVDWFVDKIKAIFGDAPNLIVKDPTFVTGVDAISDILLASKLANIRPSVSVERLKNHLRVVHLIDLAANADFVLKGPEYVKSQLRADIVMPSSAVLFSDMPSVVIPSDKARAENESTIAKLRRRVVTFQAALDELATADVVDLCITPQPGGVPFKYMALTAEFVGRKQNIASAARSLAIDATLVAAPVFADQLLVSLQADMNTLRTMQPDEERLVRIGSQWIPAEQLRSSFGLSGASTTDTVRAARPVGIADLLIVKQKIKKYVGGEVAHIENCMSGEMRRRTHERTDRVEVETLAEVETSKEEERDLQSTDKAELKQEAEQIVKSDSSIQAGVSLSASYGAVTLSTNLSSSSSTAEQDAKRQANTFSKEVVSRAVSKTMERTLSRRTEKTLFQIVETNLHEFSAKDKSATGIYQWVNKVYDAQVFNYGRRMLYEIVVPEPAAFFKQSLLNAQADGATISKPKPIDFLPAKLDDSNWYDFAAQYQLGTATPPPRLYVTAVKVYSKAGMGVGATQSDAADIDVPDGYTAISARIRSTGSYYAGTNAATDVVVGTSLTRFTTQTDDVTVHLPMQIGKVGTGFTSLNYAAFTISIEVTCYRTGRSMNQWQVKLFGELVTAYNALLSRFDQEMDRQRQQEEARPYGRNPLADERIVRGELRKSSLVLIRRDNFTGFDAVLQDQASDGPYPDPSQSDKIARIVLFFEQAFEWEQMTYRFYEYFWGRKSQWKKDLLLEDKNDEFRSFLSAGSARVILPVRPGFEKLVANYFETGSVANESDVPDVSSPEYLPILAEIKEELQAPGTEKPYGDAWPVTVPTTLVILQSAAGQLPTFAA